MELQSIDPGASIPDDVLELTPELLQLAAADPAELNTLCREYQPADVAIAMRGLPPEIAAVLLSHLPFDYSVQVLDKPELELKRYDIVRLFDLDTAKRLIEAMSADQQAGLLRERPLADRARARIVVAVAHVGVLRRLS